MASIAPLTRNDHIVIVGAGVFGLSTAVHLAKRGYHNITVYDKHSHDDSQFSYFKGADSASADVNKIIRSAYGGVDIYQDLSLEAITHWHHWNHKLRDGDDLPPGLTKDDRVFVPNGNLSMTDAADITDFDKATIASMEAAGYPLSQLDVTNPRDRAAAVQKGFGFAIDPFGREKKGQSNAAVLDTTGGTAIADKACRLFCMRLDVCMCGLSLTPCEKRSRASNMTALSVIVSPELRRQMEYAQWVEWWTVRLC